MSIDLDLRGIRRRGLLQGALAGSALLGGRGRAWAATPDLKPVHDQVLLHTDESIRRLQTWIRQPSIAAQSIGIEAGCALTIELLREAGFQSVTRHETSGHPGIFATLDAGAPRTVGIYFMYDVKQVDAREWTSPPFEAVIVDKPGLGKAVVGRGALDMKGPQATFLAAVHAIRSAGHRMPVNLVLVAEGEEEIGSPNLAQLVRRPEVLAGLGRCGEVWMPFASQDQEGAVEIDLGAKGIIELELVVSGERWGRGPRADVFSGLQAAIDSPAWRLVQALSTLVSPDGADPAIDGLFEDVRPLSPRQRAMIAAAADRQDEDLLKAQFGVRHWIHDLPFQEALERLASAPTVNIEGLVAGYTGPGGKTILPARAVAKMDLRLVPDMTASGTLAKVKAHLARRGYADIEVNMTGGYDPTETAESALLIRAAQAVYQRRGLTPHLQPRSAGSWPGCIFTGPPLNKPAGHFGLGHGGGPHAADEFYLLESTKPRIAGMAEATSAYVEFLYQLAAG
ncbi:M20/M25/M40 family metallo-hydrolase [Phenylobacterium sp. LH3H17]|uniref:M20/M25/M40 family metallo-hydrolase n=1 Tax=Phenylobacterium sp. LH3H17 TaxID=2903901 RepID=UPI0020C96D24|nr:M20/M25/M40 family metallo-hydrolase [Phenylobacterium sp. LH3H17]UTP38315.1 M20/M25/M40 family metallo-hydrolase [Phenylobacterium sp. LH3H17]